MCEMQQLLERRKFGSACATRPIHLDLVPDLTAEAFIRCFKRFSAIKEGSSGQDDLRQ